MKDNLNSFKSKLKTTSFFKKIKEQIGGQLQYFSKMEDELDFQQNR